LAIFYLKVKQFFVMIVFDIFDELVLHHDVCSLSFSEIHTWIKKSIKHTLHGKHGGSKKLIGTNYIYFQHPLSGHHYTLTKERKRLNLIRFGKAGFGL
jgi:hypothetical protein